MSVGCGCESVWSLALHGNILAVTHSLTQVNSRKIDSKCVTLLTFGVWHSLV